MHISEGVLSTPILVSSSVISLSLIAYGLKKLKADEIPLVAVFSALFFVSSFIHIPIGPASLHLVLNGILGAILGQRAFIAIAIALFFQALLFGYGGLSTLGINTFNLAMPAVIAGMILHLKIPNPLIQKIQYFSIGFFAVFLSALFLTITLWLNDESFILAGNVAFLSNIPLMVIEGFITMVAIIFLQKTYPDLITKKHL
jgi:cobalt/nickel transport system permease protein